MSDGLPDVVVDTKLETELRPHCTIHFIYEPDPKFARLRPQRASEEWVRQQELGSGGFGSVWLEKCVSGRKKDSLRAVKEIRCPSSTKPSSACVRELEAISKFSQAPYRHCFVQSLGWYESANTVFVSMEYLELGDLQQFMTMPFLGSDASSITGQILEGLVFMHEQKFAHRDLKPKNILVHSPHPAWWVKIADFGITKRIHDATGLTSNVGTEGYMAPEVQGIYPLADLDIKETDYPFAVDIWAVGAIAVYMITGQKAFPNARQLFSYVVAQTALQLPSEVDTAEWNFKEFAESTLSRSPRHRPTANQALQHLWVQSNWHRSALDAARAQAQPVRDISRSSIPSRGDSVVALPPQLQPELADPNSGGGIKTIPPSATLDSSIGVRVAESGVGIQSMGVALNRTVSLGNFTGRVKVQETIALDFCPDNITYDSSGDHLIVVGRYNKLGKPRKLCGSVFWAKGLAGADKMTVARIAQSELPVSCISKIPDGRHRDFGVLYERWPGSVLRYCNPWVGHLTQGGDIGGEIVTAQRDERIICVGLQKYCIVDFICGSAEIRVNISGSQNSRNWRSLPLPCNTYEERSIQKWTASSCCYAVFSADENYLFVAKRRDWSERQDNESIVVWNTVTLRCEATLQYGVCFPDGLISLSRRGTRLATACTICASSIEIWDLSNPGNCLTIDAASRHGGVHELLAARISPDGGRVLSYSVSPSGSHGSHPPLLEFWDAYNGAILRILEYPTGLTASIVSLDFSPCGSKAAAVVREEKEDGRYQGTIVLWNLKAAL